MKSYLNTALAALMGTTALVASQAAFAQIDQSALTDDVIVIRGALIPDEKRATSEIASVLDAESFERTGDGDIAAALARVSGISVADGKFVIVRGLNERYSSVTLNGSPLPSPEPLRRVVPLDLIPTSFLSGSLVQKTFSPEFSGEFGGGLVELRTKAVPDEFYLDFGLSIGVDLATTARDGLTHDGGGLDWLGFDDGARSVPGLAEAAFFSEPFNPVADIDALEAEFARPENLLGFEEQIAPNYSANLGLGGSVDVSDDILLGGNLALTFSNDYQTREGRRERGLVASAFADPTDTSSPLLSELTVDEILNDFDLAGTDNVSIADFISTQQTTQLNGLGSLGVEIGDNHTITSTNLVLRSTLKDTRTQTSAIASDDTIKAFQENFEFVERQVWQSQLSGEHVFPELMDLEVNWRGAYGKALRDAPFQVQTNRGFVGDAPVFPFGVFGSSFNNAATIEFSEVRDTNIDAGIDFLLPVELGNFPIDVKFGYAYTDKERDSFTRTFAFNASSNPNAELLRGVRNDVLFSEAVLGSDLFGIANGAPLINLITLDNAVSTLKVHAGYGGVDIPLGDYVRLAAGLRFETGEQVTDAFGSAQPELTRSVTTIDEDYLLPAATVTWNPIGDLQVRAGFSQTITRPQFRELTPALFRDDDSDQQILGNPFLVNAEVDNFDVRVEYYFSRGQFVTIGAFYKDIENPIEATTSSGVGGSQFQTFINAPSAEVYGFEFEFEKNFYLDEIFDYAWLADKELVFKTNYTYSQSEVSADGDVTLANVNSASGATADVRSGDEVLIDGRSLQGQSDHLVNLQIGIENAETNSRATFLVNWSSERIREAENLVGGLSRGAIVESPPLLVDFVWSRELDNVFGTGPGTEIGLEVRNILGEDYEATQGFTDGSVADFDAYNLGRTLTFNVKRSF